MESPPFNLSDPYYDTALPGMRAKVKHRVILVRHGESSANVSLMAGDQVEHDYTKGTQPMLTQIGVLQAANIAQHFEQMGLDCITRLETSVLLRAWQTAKPTMDLLVDKIQPCMRQELRERWLTPSDSKETHDSYKCIIPESSGQTWTRYSEDIHEFRKRVAGLISGWTEIGKGDKRVQTVVFTHSLVIEEILNQLIGGPPPSKTSACSALWGSRRPLFHISNGSFTVFDVDTTDRIHIHMVNFTEHLGCCSGHHTAHVKQQRL